MKHENSLAAVQQSLQEEIASVQEELLKRLAAEGSIDLHAVANDPHGSFGVPPEVFSRALAPFLTSGRVQLTSKRHLVL